MEEIYVNVAYETPEDPKPSLCQGVPRSSEKKDLRVVVLSLGLLSVLLLAAVVGLSVHSLDLPAKSSILSERLWASLTEQRDRLNVSLTEKTKELEKLQTLSRAKKTCSVGWKKFGCSCYLFSTQSSSWNASRQDCRGRGADLVIVDDSDEQIFLSNSIEADTWIGLSDRDNEGTWKWTDDTPLTKTSFWKNNQPDNGLGDPKWGEEDCALLEHGHKSSPNWNDIRCEASMQWICETFA